MLRSKRARKVLAVACGALFILVVGMVAGFFIAKYVGTQMLTKCYEGRMPTDSTSKGSLLPAGYQRGMPLNVSNLRQLPEPGTAEAQDLAAGSDTQGTTFIIYQLYEDAELITEKLTEAFLGQLQLRLSDQTSSNGGDDSEAAFFSSLVPSGTNMTQVLETLKGVARDILNYCRYYRSDAILPLLREFSQRGSLAIADVDPDLLRSEVQTLLNLTTMSHWYAVSTKSDTSVYKTEPWTAAVSSSSSSSSNGGATQLLVASSPATTANAPSGRRLLLPAYSSATSPSYPHYQQQQGLRHLQAGAAIPDLPDVVGPILSLTDMLCLIAPFNPTGLKGITIPKQLASSNSSSGAISCNIKPPIAYQKFKPVEIPVVFHCQRYLDGDVLQPPMWGPQQAGQNLISVANRLYKGTGISFKLQEVRSDVQKYPYLLLSSLSDWQTCSGTPNQEAAGFPCLRDTAKFPDVAALAQKLVINVIVSGSQTSAYCNGTSTEDCTSLYLGYCGAMGPWFARPSPTWKEGLSEENWVFISWDQFSPSVKNAWRFWDGGGVTLAHELGHYLGLMHTHEGSTPCEGDGLTKADSVPDTPVNLQTEQWAAQNGLGVQLSRWCSEFRNSRSPDAKALLPFNSCKKDDTIDNVFNLLSYLPDPCCMILSPNQIVRLQWAISNFRPKMMAQFAA